HVDLMEAFSAATKRKAVATSEFMKMKSDETNVPNVNEAAEATRCCQFIATYLPVFLKACPHFRRQVLHVERTGLIVMDRRTCEREGRRDKEK
ncbi:MAG: hypothetical protein E6833_01640, partial [Bradyrhizobium sp.]|nr:hypothetical protein [Bradyrhizobium sp.]